MALREFTVTFFNETPFTLRRQKADVSTGEWELEVPAQIGPGGMAQWKTVSPGWFRGTSGAATFVIDDTKHLSAPTSIPAMGAAWALTGPTLMSARRRGVPLPAIVNKVYCRASGA